MNYKVRQTQAKKYFFNLLTKEVTKEYNFSDYMEAVKFALYEQIKFIYKGTKILNVFKSFYNIEEFKKHAKNNPFHFLNISCSKRVNLDIYYKILIDKNITKLSKFNVYKINYKLTPGGSKKNQKQK